jgi:ABC-type Fe3+-siderophore transport system permease subunit
MNIVLLILTLISFTISLVTILFYYAPASMKLKSIMDQINSEENSNGPMTRFLRYLSNGNPYNSMFIDLPKAEKYLEQDDISELVHRIRLSRKILKLALGSMILCIVLMLILE